MVAPIIGAAARMAAKKAVKKTATQTGEEALEKLFLGSLGATGAAAAGALGQEVSDRIDGGGSYERRLREQQQQSDKKEREYEAEKKRESRGMKSGGKVSSASRRADGCAQRGKTKGRFV